MTEVIWSTRAERDRLVQLDWYAEFSADTASRMARRINSQVRLLSAFPRLGYALNANTFRLNVPRTPFVLIYLLESPIRIVRLLHSAQDWPGRF